MIFSYFIFLLSFILINANEQYDIGIINHNTQWHIHCQQNKTQIINPPLNDQPIITYQCPYPSLSTNIVPIEVDLTFVCRLQPRLIWIMVDLYQYNIWSWTINNQSLNISIKLNQKIQINDYKSEIVNYKNRFILINAFYIPFEHLDILLNEYIEILIQINQCKFYINENIIWNDIIHKNCTTIESKTLHAHYAQCDFFPKSVALHTNHRLLDEISDNDTTNIPDFNVILTIDEQRQQFIETTTRDSDYHLLLDEHYRQILSTLTNIVRLSKLITFIFIFTIIVIVLLILFFIYILFYHYRTRSIRKSTLLV